MTAASRDKIMKLIDHVSTRSKLGSDDCACNDCAAKRRQLFVHIIARLTELLELECLDVQFDRADYERLVRLLRRRFKLVAP